MIDSLSHPAGTPVVVGAGWIGRSLTAHDRTWRIIARRAFVPGMLPVGAPVVIASGCSAVPRGTSVEEATAAELAHLRQVLQDAVRAAAPRVVVLGSSDVAGLAPIILGSTPRSPTHVYGEVKAAAEEEALRWRRKGLDIVVGRLAPVHGPGKAQTTALLRLARRPIVPLPGGGLHSVGFVTLRDVRRAVHRLLLDVTPPVVAVGGGAVPLRELVGALAEAQGHQLRVLAVPVPKAAVAVALRRLQLPDQLRRWARLCLPRAVEMEVGIAPMPLRDAARVLAAGSEPPMEVRPA